MFLIQLCVNCFYLDFSILTIPREMLQVNSSVNGRYYISDIVVTVEDGHSTKTYTVSIQL